MKKYVLIIMDGAADRARIGGKSPLQIARTPNIDYLTFIGASGLMTTLYDDRCVQVEKNTGRFIGVRKN